MTKKRQSQNDLEAAANSPLVGILSVLLGNSPAARAVAVIVVIVGLFLVAKLNENGATTPNVPAPANTSAPAKGGSGSPVGLPAATFKQTAKQITFKGCPPEGDGGDPVLNLNKNRVDEGNYQPVAFNTLLELRWPQETERADHAKWS